MPYTERCLYGTLIDLPKAMFKKHSLFSTCLPAYGPHSPCLTTYGPHYSDFLQSTQIWFLIVRTKIFSNAWILRHIPHRSGVKLAFTMCSRALIYIGRCWISHDQPHLWITQDQLHWHNTTTWNGRPPLMPVFKSFGSCEQLLMKATLNISQRIFPHSSRPETEQQTNKVAEHKHTSKYEMRSSYWTETWI